MSVSDENSTPWYRSTLVLALIGSLLLWAALPPLAIGWLGWLASVPWLVLVQNEQLRGRRPYRAIYVASLAFWLATIHWLRLPHPAVYLGWFALSAYLAIFLPLFVGLSRVAVHRLRIPLWLAAPTIWTGLELARAHVMTGFMMGSLAHTQARWPAVIQIADLAGEYGVDFLMILSAVGVVGIMQGFNSFNPQSAFRNPKLSFLSAVPAAIALIGALAYGQSRLAADTTGPPPRTARIALIQGNSLADWKFDEDKQRQIMDEYISLSFDAVKKSRELGDGRPPDVVVWPETMFRVPLMSFDKEYQLPADATRTKDDLSAAGRRELARFVAAIGTPALVGVDRREFKGPGYIAAGGDKNASQTATEDNSQVRVYNSSALIDKTGQIVGTYDKIHLVMFGEYVPFARWLPVLDKISSISGAVQAGADPVALCTGGVCYAPNICYETVMPHVIRRQVTQLTDKGQSPDVLVNLTNDAWYWGSNELAQHLACGVFRAIETRRPLVIAANGGISAWIDDRGRIRAESPIQKPDIILADVELKKDAGLSFYMRTGDWFPGLCLACCVVLAIIGYQQRWTSRQSTQPAT